MDRTFKCRECSGPTVAYEIQGVWIPLVCERCRKAELARRNRARVAELDSQLKVIVPALYRATDGNHPHIDQTLLGKILEWKVGGKGIGLFGPTGGCKTRMMFLLVRKLHYLEHKVRWIRAIDLSRAASGIFDDDSAIKGNARKLLKNALQAEVLFIDDLGKERFTDRSELELYHLIESRTSCLRPILWTSNASGSDLRDLMSENRGTAITRRLAEFSTVYPVQPYYERANPIEQFDKTSRSAARGGAV